MVRTAETLPRTRFRNVALQHGERCRNGNDHGCSRWRNAALRRQAADSGAANAVLIDASRESDLGAVPREDAVEHSHVAKRFVEALRVIAAPMVFDSGNPDELAGATLRLVVIASSALARSQDTGAVAGPRT
jgi:hypothetical protein